MPGQMFPMSGPLGNQRSVILLQSYSGVLPKIDGHHPVFPDHLAGQSWEPAGRQTRAVAGYRSGL